MSFLIYIWNHKNIPKYVTYDNIVTFFYKSYNKYGLAIEA